jgi:hypothetical protein
MIIQNNLYTNPYNIRAKAKTQNSLNFSGPRLPNQTFEAFQSWAEKTDFLSSIQNIFEKKNFMDAGSQNYIYKIPNNDTFLLRVSQKISLPKLLSEKLSIKKSIDPFRQNNFGQEIALVGDNISVIIKQTGRPNGMKKWVKSYTKNLFSKKDIPEFIENLELVAKMDQNAYNTLAKELQLLFRKKYSFDHINPRNILIDEKMQIFNIVDIAPFKKLFHKISKGNSSNYILMTLMDQRQILKAFDLSNKKQKIKIKLAAKQIKNKTKIASKFSSLKENNMLLKLKFKCLDLLKGKNSNLLGEFIEFKTFLANL